MIIYENRLNQFIQDVELNIISDILIQKFRMQHIGGGSPGEVNSWNNSLHFMKDVLQCHEIPTDCKVAIEYNIPQTSKRVDFMILGADYENNNHIVIVELKQWAQVHKVDDWARHSVLSDLRSHEPVSHPSYQAFSYKSLILNYCDVENLGYDSLNPCAYLHNMNESFRPILEDKLYSEWIDEAPVFLKGDVLKLRAFILRYIASKSSDDELLYKIDFGRLKPTKSLQYSLDSMLCGNKEFKMIDEQAVAYDFIMNAIRKSQCSNQKYVIIIQGGPGTGKSVLAINVLVDCIRYLGLNASYITKNSAPRNCYKKGNARKEIDLNHVICSPYVLPGIPNNGLDVGIFDEAHRMVKQPNRYSGHDMLCDAINASKTAVFFIDDDQRITTKDIYTTDTIISYAEKAGAVIYPPKPYTLSSQFRCNGSDGYIAFLDNILGLKKTANPTLDTKLFDFRVFDTPQEMKDALLEADAGQNKSRMCAGYCYDWNVKYKRGDWDVVIGDFKAKWNLEKDTVFAVNPNSFNEIGCIHTVQGMDFNYVGVIIGNDLVFRDNAVITNRASISKDDLSSGIRTCSDAALADKLIRNTYKVLMTRGLKGCFIYCEDAALREFFRSCIPEKKQREAKNLVLLPIVGEIAAGHEHYTEDEVLGKISVESKNIHPYKPGDFFFLRVSGDSMIEAGIKDGDTVLIRRMNNPKEEIHDGDIVACQIHGDRATLKSFYQTQDGIRLHPENPEFKDIFISNREFMIGEARIIGKYVKIH